MDRPLKPKAVGFDVPNECRTSDLHFNSITTAEIALAWLEFEREPPAILLNAPRHDVSKFMTVFPFADHYLIWLYEFPKSPVGEVDDHTPARQTFAPLLHNLRNAARSPRHLIGVGN